MTRFTVIAAVAIAIAFALSMAAASAQAPPPNPPDPHIADGSLQRRLDDARRNWKAANVRSYRFDLARSCFCPPQKTRLVVVHGGVPKRWPSGLKPVATVPRLFQVIQDAIDARAAKITAAYGRRGVPREIYIDRAIYVADEESGYSISRFTLLKPRAG
ncbi:MAG: hypothetical protein H0W96_15205 [Solirubrobacterales bacterium]|nr:hypothetical protein [Solirubrobacterales bacterium]